MTQTWADAMKAAKYEATLPVLVSVADIEELLGCGHAIAQSLTKRVPPSGSYTPPKGRRVHLYALSDVRREYKAVYER